MNRDEWIKYIEECPIDNLSNMKYYFDMIVKERGLENIGEVIDEVNNILPQYGGFSRGLWTADIKGLTVRYRFLSFNGRYDKWTVEVLSEGKMVPLLEGFLDTSSDGARAFLSIVEMARKFN